MEKAKAATEILILYKKIFLFNVSLIFARYIDISKSKSIEIYKKEMKGEIKMKKLAAAIIAVAAAGMFTGCGIFGGNDIGRDEALQVALDDAGVDEADTTRLKVSEDRDDGRKVYEIQFDAGDREYDYEIQASDGRILSADTEMIAQGQNSGSQNNTSGGQSTDTAQDSGSTQNSTQDQSGSGNAQSTQNNAGTNTANVAITLEQATAIALERVPGATDQDIRISLDNDDGIQKYEGDIIYDQKEYDFEIDANTGTILEWSEERV